MGRLTTLKPRIQMAQSRQLAQAPDVDSWRQGKTTAERGYGGKWQRERERFLFKNPLCCYCQAEGRVTVATVVDHKTPHRGDQSLFWDQKNWQPMCAPCHDSTKRSEENQNGGW